MEGIPIADLIAIGYEHEDTAARAERELERSMDDLLIEPDAVALIARDGDGRYKVQTNHHPVASGATWGMLWGTLFGFLFFVPVVGMAVGEGLGELMDKVERIGIDSAFQEQARDLLQPGTSALFMVVDEGRSTEVIGALSPYGGRTLSASLSTAAQSDLQDHLHGGPAPLNRTFDR